MKQLKRLLASLLSGVVLFAMCPVCLTAQAAELSALPDNLTPEMAQAYAGIILNGNYNELDAVGLLFMGEMSYPVLYTEKIYGNPTIWIYNVQTQNCQELTVASYGMNIAQSSGRIFLFEYNDSSWIQVPPYDAQTPYGAGLGEEVIEAHSNEEEALTLYTVESGAFQKLDFFKTAHCTVPYSEYNDYDWGISKDPWSYITLSRNAEASQTISESEYESYFKKYFGGLHGDNLIRTYGNGISLADVAIVYAEKKDGNSSEISDFGSTLAWLGMAGHETYDQLTNIASSMDEQTLGEMEASISFLINPDESTAFESATLSNKELLQLAFRAMWQGILGDVPVMEDYSGAGSYEWCYLQGGLSCEDINKGIEHMIGRTVDFTPCLFKTMPVPGVDVVAFEPFAYDKAFYFFSNETVWWAPYICNIQRVYDIENNLFLADASIGCDDEGYYTYYGHIMAVFHQADGAYQLLKVYPLNTAPDLGEVRRYAVKANPEPNFKIDYEAVKEFTELRQYAEALEAALPVNSILNDAGNSAVTAYLEYAAGNYQPALGAVRKNVVTITPEAVEAAQSAAAEMIQALQAVLRDKNIVLNRAPVITVRMDAGGLDLSEPLQVRIGGDAAGKLSSADALVILLQDNQHTITAQAEELRQTGSLYVQMETLDKDKYRFSFLDETGSMIVRSPASVVFTVPAVSEFATIQAIYNGNSDNWGGQYDLPNHTISFQTPYTGDYFVLDGSIEIGDIDMLNPELQQAIRFMVSRGYFGLDEDQNFSPGTVLNRYSFAQTLVKIFFALDREAAATFTDVEQGGTDYPYVASGQQEKIINGYEDNTFRGENDVLRWHVIAFCSRSLANKKGYTRPADPSVYLNFVDNDLIATYKEDDVKDIALAVREGLIDNGGVLRPNQEITKAEAAWMLYKLFMLLYEISPARIVIEEAAVTSAGSRAPLLFGGAAIGGIGVAAAVYFALKKRGKKATV